MPEPRALAAQLVVPVFDLRPGRDLEAEWTQAQRWVDLGVGGLILFGGEKKELAVRLPALKASATRGLLIGSDLERGLAQQVHGARDLPPAMTLGATDDEALAERAGASLAREALSLGIDWILGPVLDLADEPENPIVGTRAFGSEPELGARLGVAFIRGVQSCGALACAKHYPGHGATTRDSHDELPVVSRPGEQLRARDLLPFRRAVEAGVASVMTAHVSYPTLTDDPAPATVNADLVDGLLRGQLGFRGLVVTDALIMEGVRQDTSEEDAAVRAIEAGCDLLLYPKQPEAVIERLARWAEEDPAHLARLTAAAERVERAKARVFDSAATDELDDPGPEIARRAVTRVGPARPPLKEGDEITCVVIDDDELPSLGHALLAELDEAGVVIRPVVLRGEPTAAARARLDAALISERIIAVVGCRVRAWKCRPGLAPLLGELLGGLPGERTTVVGLCGPYPLRGALPAEAELLLAYGDEPSCQRAAAAVLLGAPAPGTSPVA